jgi:hypothetical protein
LFTGTGVFFLRAGAAVKGAASDFEPLSSNRRVHFTLGCGSGLHTMVCRRKGGRFAFVTYRRMQRNEIAFLSASSTSLDSNVLQQGALHQFPESCILNWQSRTLRRSV